MVSTNRSSAVYGNEANLGWTDLKREHKQDGSEKIQP